MASGPATDVTFHEYATTGWGTDVHVVGSVASLGSWNTADAVPLSSESYPTWSRLVIVPKNTAFTYTYVQKDGSGNVTWGSGTNRSYTTDGSSGYTTSDSWKQRRRRCPTRLRRVGHRGKRHVGDFPCSGEQIGRIAHRTWCRSPEDGARRGWRHRRRVRRGARVEHCHRERSPEHH
ncbi:carbohydrate-binding module family 20 domain-containing protein [Streptomyces sp. NPDC059224]|uniref:carbohydrate-binding module family 20 domain-containing protein n=1 Tax=Streptomyces sp. NPDC059224 TaxID=3346775 RepID=UPI00369C7F1D